MDTRVILNLFHILLVAPYLIWVGISRGVFPDWVFISLIVLGIFVTLYHAYKAFNRYMAGSSTSG